MCGLSLLPDDSLHLDIPWDTLADARGSLPCGNWARGIDVAGLPVWALAHFISCVIGALDSHSFVAIMASYKGRGDRRSGRRHFWLKQTMSI